jgi:AcrR family transcriptional regulator
MLDEIKNIASRHLATDGANLSLRAVARDVGLVSSAIYRYFPSRDDLLTALIIDAYNAIGEAAEHGDATTKDRGDLRGRFLATAHAVRDWALAHPAEYALLYGSPVPGYAAPTDTITPAGRTPLVLVRILADGAAAGSLRPADQTLPDAVRGDLTRLAEQIAPDLPPEVLMRGTVAWIHLFGAVSFELFGQLNNVIEARTEYFQRQMTDMADLMGLP